MHIENPPNRSIIFSIIKGLTDMVEKPVIWFRETVVVPNRQEYAWYHEQVRRVPTIDECYTDDLVCIFEADQQFKRDRLVDSNILSILRRRYENCCFYNRPDESEVCEPIRKDWVKAQTNFFIKYGDLKYPGYARDAYMKQKHRMIWERRHGPVGGEARTNDDKWNHKCDWM